MDLNQWLALFLILVGIVLIFYAIHGFKLSRERQKIWKELAKVFKDIGEKLTEDQEDKRGELKEKLKEELNELKGRK